MNKLLSYQKFANSCAESLGIPHSRIVVKAFHPTNLMTYVDGTLYLNPKTKNTLDIMFSICHELRHAWQLKHYPHLYDEYKNINECSDHMEYNMQILELDANVYACQCMYKITNQIPLFPSLKGYKEIMQEYVSTGKGVLETTKVD